MKAYLVTSNEIFHQLMAKLDAQGCVWDHGGMKERAGNSTPLSINYPYCIVQHGKHLFWAFPESLKHVADNGEVVVLHEG